MKETLNPINHSPVTIPAVEKEKIKDVKKQLLPPLKKMTSQAPDAVPAVAPPHSLAKKKVAPLNHNAVIVPTQEEKEPSQQTLTNKIKLNHLSEDELKRKMPLISRELRKINIKQLVDTIQPLIEGSVTPLILDNSGRCDIFFQYSGDYSGIFVDAKKILVQTLIQKVVTMEETLEQLRGLLVSALKYGRTLVIHMGDTACDFMNKFNSSDCFPVQDLFVEAGQRFKSEKYWEKVVRPQDREHGTFIVRPEFSVLIISAFSLEDYEEFLEKAIPLTECCPIYIQPAPQQNQVPRYSP